MKPQRSPVVRLLEWMRFFAELPFHVAFHVSLVIRLFFRLLTHLLHGSGAWAVMALRLVLYVLLLLPAFMKMLLYWLFDPSVVKHVEYGEGETQRNMLDVYLPRRSDGRAVDDLADAEKMPVIVFFTGGAWIIGYKAWGALMAQTLAESGFVVVIPDYRNFPQATIGDMVQDARNALTWVFTHVGRYGGDVGKVAVAGQSAGAHISACLMMDQLERELKLEQGSASTTFEWTLSQISMYFGISGPYNLCTMEGYFHSRGLDSRILKWIMQSDLSKFSPSNLPFRDDLLELARRHHDRPSHPAFIAATSVVDGPARPTEDAFDENIGRFLPPIGLFHGEVDKSVPYSVAVEFAENLKLAGANVNLRVYEHWSHTDPILEGPMGGDDSLCYDMMAAFANALTVRTRHEQAPAKRAASQLQAQQNASTPSVEMQDIQETKVPEMHDAAHDTDETSAAKPESNKSAKRKAKKKAKKKQKQMQMKQQPDQEQASNVLSEPETAVPEATTSGDPVLVAEVIVAEDDAEHVSAQIMHSEVFSGEYFGAKDLTRKRTPMASPFLIHAARYINPF